MKYNRLLVFTFAMFFVAKQGVCQKIEWARDFGGNSASLGHTFRSTLDKENNLICAAGQSLLSWNYLDFNQTVPTPNGFSVSKVDTSGNLVWLNVYDAQMGARDIIILSDSSILIVGMFQNTVNFDPGGTNYTLTALGPPTYYYSGFQLKLTSDGQFEWVRQFDYAGGYTSTTFNTDVDNDDNIYTSTTFSGDSVDCDPLNSTFYLYPTNNSGNAGNYFSKTSEGGILSWVKQFDVLTFGDYARTSDICVLEDNIYMGGTFSGTVNFDPGTSNFIHIADTSANNSNAIFLTKIDTSGIIKWVKVFRGEEASLGTKSLACLAVDSLDNIYAMGYHKNQIDFDPDTTQTYFTPVNGQSDYGYVLKLDSAGNFLWVNDIRIGGCVGCATIISTNQSLKLDDRGFIYWGGTAVSLVDFNPDPTLDTILFVNQGMFFAKYDTDGNYVWAAGLRQNYPNSAISPGYVTSLNIANNGDVFIGGHSPYEFDIDPSDSSWIIDPQSTTYFIARYTQDICSEIALSIDSLNLVDCTGNGFVASTLHHASTPFNFLWNGQVTNGFEVLDSTNYGLNELTAIDNNGCEVNKYLYVDGPLYLNDFDLNTDISSTSFRPGFDAYIHLNALNNGCAPQDGVVALILDSGIIFNSATLPPAYSNGDTLFWEFNGLTYNSGNIYSLVRVAVSNQLQIGDTICLESFITPSFGDVNPSNNFKQNCSPLINGYDPNDKQVFPSGKCDENFISLVEPLTYMIRFQNTGNASAINVVIEDSILDNLDINTIHLLGSSHDMYLDVKNNGKISFVFDEINLPDSSSNLIGSQGSVFFSIRASTGAMSGDVVKNSAEIYFDFNPAIITNETMNTFYEGNLSLLQCNLSIAEINSNGLTVFPNPTKGELFFSGLKDQSITSIEVQDMTGRTIRIFNPSNSENKSSISLNDNGLFLLKFISNNEVVGFEKIIVEH